MIKKNQVPDLLIKEAKDIASGRYFMMPMDDYKNRLERLQKEIEENQKEIEEIKATINDRETLKQQMIYFLNMIGETLD